MPHIGDMDCCRLGVEVKKKFPHLPVVLLTHSVRDTIGGLNASTPTCIDNTFVWCCDSDVLLAIVKNVEDRVNVDADIEKAMVRLILFVEDSAQYRSRLLPLLYAEVVHQTQAVLDEGLNEKHRLLKMRARPKILMASTYEEAQVLFDRYRQNIFCVMSDARFPKQGILCDDAGLQFLKNIRKKQPDLPLLLLSTERGNKKPAEAIPAVFVAKTSQEVRGEIHDFFLRYLGFGDFVFRLPDGTEVGRAKNLHALEQQLNIVPERSILYHARNNHFFNWVMARTEISLAARLHKRFYRRVQSSKLLQEDLISKIHALRKLRQQGVIAQFDRESYDPEIMDFVKMGSGSIGGKARGLAFIATKIFRSIRQDSALSEHTVKIPKSCVIANDGFDNFVAENNLQFIKGESDSAIADRFLQGGLPQWLLLDLRAFLKKIDGPLSVRSSSLLEDAQFRPYAGLYSTFMLVNGDEDFEIRFQQLQQAVKLVYASTWFADPRAFSHSIGQNQDDSMAVIIQQLAGSRYGAFFYPAISGVAQSYNYYPVAPMTAHGGIAHIALGFGKTVVEGEQSLRFSPEFPKNLPQFSTVDDILANAQRWTYSLDCRHPEQFSGSQGNLIRRGVDEAVDEQAVRLLSSTYFPEEHRIRDADLPGPKVLSFANILKYNTYPLPELLTELMSIGKEGMGCEVEIEFVVDLQEKPQDNVFYFLQIRPIVTGSESAQVKISQEERGASVLRSKRALGHGRFPSLRDIVFIRRETFDIALTGKIAAEISRVNRGLEKGGRPYLLLGPGRWGTADPWLGVPVQWHDISGVGAIVELQDCSIRAEPSQGSHFFQNITSLGIPYLMVQDERCAKGLDMDREFIHWDFFSKLKTLYQGEYIIHAVLPETSVLKVDGHSSEALLFLTAR